MPTKKCLTCGKSIDLSKKKEQHSSVRLEYFHPNGKNFELKRSYFCSQECFGKKVKGATK